MTAAATATMRAQTAQTPSDPSCATATYPRWVMFEQQLKIDADGSSCSTSGDASKTSVAAHTSTGLPIQVSLRLAEPPAVSCVCVQITGGLVWEQESKVLAAHGDSVLIMVKHGYGHTTDHFVYNAGAADTDPPRPLSLTLLPPFDFGYHYYGTGLGLVRRGKDELVVARLETVSSDILELAWVADLSLFRSGEWSVRRLLIRLPDTREFGELPSFSNAVVPVGDGLLCWVDLRKHIVVLCDVFEETPKLQYLPLPRENICGNQENRNVCASAGGEALKFINIFPRCCCGGAGASLCSRSHQAYTIETWTTRISNDDNMQWVKDGMVDATELWPLDSYKGLRCFPLDHPVVSLDEPNLICFWLHEPSVYVYEDVHQDWLLDLLMVNMTSKTIQSVSRNKDGLLYTSSQGAIPSNVSYFFNSYRCSASDGTLTGQRQKGTERPPPNIVDEELIRIKRQCTSIISNPTLHPVLYGEPSVQASEICEAFEEIPSYGFDHDEVKVYRILSRDNCRRVRSLLRLPKNQRKEWLLMEIKANGE